MKLTKMDMAKVIVTALYELDELVTENHKMAWSHAKKLCYWKKYQLKSDYERAYKILINREVLKK